jgi:mono/diheme cytochrome c family protein
MRNLALTGAAGALIGAVAGCSAKNTSAPEAASIPKSAGAQSAATAATSAAGERIYDGNCVPCHQQSGAGIPGVYPGLAASPVVLGDPAQLALWVMKGQRPASMPAGRYPTQMLQFGWLKPADAAALFTYLRSSFGNSAAPVDADTVARAVGQ